MSESTRHKGQKKYMSKRDSFNHVHLLLTMANVADEHQHVIVGTTGPAMETEDTHVHVICIRTSFDPKCDNPHWHIVDEMTGPAIELPGGEHTHFFRGATTYVDGHKHCFSSVTDASPDSDGYEEEYEQECEEEEEYEQCEEEEYEEECEEKKKPCKCHHKHRE